MKKGFTLLLGILCISCLGACSANSHLGHDIEETDETNPEISEEVTEEDTTTGNDFIVKIPIDPDGVIMGVVDGDFTFGGRVGIEIGERVPIIKKG